MNLQYVGGLPPPVICGWLGRRVAWLQCFTSWLTRSLASLLGSKVLAKSHFVTVLGAVGGLQLVVRLTGCAPWENVSSDREFSEVLILQGPTSGGGWGGEVMEIKVTRLLKSMVLEAHSSCRLFILLLGFRRLGSRRPSLTDSFLYAF